MIGGKLILNPSAEEMQVSKLDLVVAGTANFVTMVESEAEFLTEEQMLEAINFAHVGFQPTIRLIKELKLEVGKPQQEVKNLFPRALKDKIFNIVNQDVKKVFSLTSKHDREKRFDQIIVTLQDDLIQDNQYSQQQIDSAFNQVKGQIFRNEVLQSKIRIDGRTSDEIRSIQCEVGLFPQTHGSALFTRGNTQSIVTSTLGTIYDEQIVDGISGEYREHFY